MKKTLFLIAILTAGISNAQEATRDRNPEQMASIQSKKMTLALDLDAKQQAQVEKLLMAHGKERLANKMTKEDRSELTNVQKFTALEQMLENKITRKREMKSILDADQYIKWEKMIAIKTKDKRKAAKQRRGTRRDRNN
jgi:gamma-glutamylcysteine synthetase